ncbi:hypothetical protein [Marinobacter sp. S6332]|uniref:hypothetical protein n=1 Tax=Marinobacter sp. S6332 TaxID=2926403 RepID=UPI001FF1FAEE|nr:hypothetical protein [Marinobacter sp. S6332]MCK0163711.1 hypothetical protein [Marinobacter sp. S6332]
MHITNSTIFSSKAGLAVVFSALLGVTGCGGSSSSGGGDPANGGDNGGGNGGGTVNEQPANIQSEDDAELGANAAVESARQAILLEDVPTGGFPGGVTIAEQSQSGWLHTHTLDLVKLNQLPTAADVVVIEGDCGGNVTFDSNDGGNSLRYNFNNYCVSDGSGGDRQVVDGTMSYFGYENIGTEGRWGYDFNYTITYRGETELVQGSYTCNGTGFTGCSYANNYEGRNGRSYRSENVSVSESNGNYDVSARVYDEDIGYVDYQASNLVLCEGGYGFSSGTITVSDEASNEVLTVTFSGCSSFTMTYQGTGYTIEY